MQRPSRSNARSAAQESHVHLRCLPGFDGPRTVSKRDVSSAREGVWQGRRRTSTSSTRFEVMSKRRKGFPSEARVKRGTRVVHGNKELLPREARAE